MKIKLSTISTIGYVISFVMFIITFISQSYAFDMTNSFYKIDSGNFNSFSGKAAGSGKTLNFTSGELAPGKSSDPGYTVRSGFQYIKSTSPFTFAISNSSIDFGTLNAGEPITRTNTLTINPGAATGFQVIGYEKDQLKAESGQPIPDSTCDDGTCTETTASSWKNPLTYGFGYRCDDLTSQSCDSEFLAQDYYKQFANSENKEAPQTLMSSTSKGTKKTKITYKINIPGSQAPGLYQNGIVYIATPSL